LYVNMPSMAKKERRRSCSFEQIEAKGWGEEEEQEESKGKERRRRRRCSQ